MEENIFLLLYTYKHNNYFYSSITYSVMWGIGPKKKRSIHKRNVRHASRERDILKKLSNMVALSTCTHCGAKKLAHRVCKACGYYGDRQVLSIKVKWNASIIDA